MFGLDARIALAIFGALSVISGAALYSAIQAAKTEQWRQYFREMIKASEQAYLDVGEQMGVIDTGTTLMLNVDMLFNSGSFSSVIGWKGPYITVNSGSGGGAFIDPISAQLNIVMGGVLMTGTTWPNIVDGSSNRCAVNNKDCYEWIETRGCNPSASCVSLFNNLDNAVDGGDGAMAGNVRYNTSNDRMYYKSMPHVFRG